MMCPYSTRHGHHYLSAPRATSDMSRRARGAAAVRGLKKRDPNLTGGLTGVGGAKDRR